MIDAKLAGEKAKNVKLIILDVDGVLTEGEIFVSESREVMKSFFCRDGLAITLARKCGLKTAIITGRTSPPVVYRARELHITKLYQGTLDKREAYRDLKEIFHLKDEEICYIGDDLIDLPLLLQVGFPAVVADAVPEALDAAAFVSKYPGGRGAVREIIEFILKAKGLWQDVLDFFAVEPKGPLTEISQ